MVYKEIIFHPPLFTISVVQLMTHICFQLVQFSKFPPHSHCKMTFQRWFCNKLKCSLITSKIPQKVANKLNCNKWLLQLVTYTSKIVSVKCTIYCNECHSLSSSCRICHIHLLLHLYPYILLTVNKNQIKRPGAKTVCLTSIQSRQQ